MQKNRYQVQQSTVKYRFSFRTLSDRNMKMGCRAMFLLQRLNLIYRGYIILDGTSVNLKNVKTFSFRNIRQKSRHYTVKAWKPLSILERI